MKGYVRNISPVWRHALKRNIGPGEKVSLEELYKQYGEKHGIRKGRQFIEWLKTVKLRDSTVFEVVFKEDEPVKEQSKEVVDEFAEVSDEQAAKDEIKSNYVSPLMKVDTKIEDIVKMSVREAREGLKKITDTKVLRYALNIANQTANKDSLCILLRKRIQELERM